VIYIVLKHFVSYYDEYCFNCWDLVFFKIFLDMLMFTRLPCHGPLLSSIVFNKINLFQRFLLTLLLFIVVRSIVFIGCGGRNLDQKTHLNIIK
jgi:hypothetical protein